MKNETLHLIKKFVKDRNWDQFHSSSNLAKSVSIEAAELLELFQWNDNVDKQNLEEEIADIFIYLSLLASKNNIDIDDAVINKIQINEKRYPISKSKNNSKKYTRL